MAFKLSNESILLFIIKNRLILLLSLLGLLIAIIAISSTSYFLNKKRANVSANIAIGISYLEQEQNDKALFYFQEAFNSSNGIYGIIAGSGIIQSLKESKDSNEKIINIFKIIKEYKAPTFINMIVLASFLEYSSHFQKDEVKKSDLEKLQKFGSKMQKPFTQILESIELNLAK
jgi:hypothetical protein